MLQPREDRRGQDHWCELGALWARMSVSKKVTRGTTRPRVYSDVNVTRPKEYWDYESIAVQWG